MAISTPFRVTAALAALLAAAGCKATGRGDDAGAGADADTTGAGAVGGMTDAQIQEQVKPVSPDEARAMGIPDSSTLPGSVNEVSDSSSSPAAQPATPVTPADSARAAAPGAKPGASAPPPKP